MDDEAVAHEQRIARLLADFSLEMTGKDLADLAFAAPFLPAGTRVNVTYLGSEDRWSRVAAAGAVGERGLVPVPHISARRLRSEADLREFLRALREVGASEHVLVVGGDPAAPAGPYGSAEDVIRSGLLQDHEVRHVSIAGYPEGHPDIDEERLWSALSGKIDALQEAELKSTIITQFGFDEEPVLRWAERVRAAGIGLPIRVGVPGPAGVKRLIGFARRFGVGANAMIVKKYGFSLAGLAGTAGPERFIAALAAGYDPVRHGVLGLHFYTFGGVAVTAEWVQRRGEAWRRRSGDDAGARGSEAGLSEEL